MADDAPRRRERSSPFLKLRPCWSLPSRATTSAVVQSLPGPFGLGSSFSLKRLAQPGRLDGQPLGVGGVGEGILLDVVEEALVARAAGSSCGPRRARRSRSSAAPGSSRRSRCAARTGSAASADRRSSSSILATGAAVAAVAERAFVQPGLRQRLRRLLQLRAHLLDDGRRLQIDEQLHEFAIHVIRLRPGTAGRASLASFAAVSLSGSPMRMKTSW